MKFEVETGQLSEAVRGLKDTLTNIQRNQKGMYDSMESLDAMWQGEAHDAFKAQYTNDNIMMTNLVNDLTRLFDDIGTCRQSYDTCEAEVRQMARNLQV